MNVGDRVICVEPDHDECFLVPGQIYEVVEIEPDPDGHRSYDLLRLVGVVDGNGELVGFFRCRFALAAPEEDEVDFDEVSAQLAEMAAAFGDILSALGVTRIEVGVRVEAGRCAEEFNAALNFGIPEGSV